MPDPNLIIDPADDHHAVETLKELLSFWLLVNLNAPDRGMGHRFVQEAVAVLRTAEWKYGDGHEVAVVIGLIVIGGCRISWFWSPTGPSGITTYLNEKVKVILSLDLLRGTIGEFNLPPKAILGTTRRMLPLGEKLNPYLS